LQSFFQSAFTSCVDAGEQQVFEQVRQLFLLAVEVIQTNPYHQADRHMVALVTGLQDHLQAVGQQVTLDPRAIEGK